LIFAIDLIKLIKKNHYRAERRNGQIFTTEKLYELIGKLEESYSENSASYFSFNNQNENENDQSQTRSGSESESDDDSRYF